MATESSKNLQKGFEAWNQRHPCREFWAFAEENREAAMREAGLDG